MWTFLTGKRLTLDDPELAKLNELMANWVERLGQDKIVEGFPWLRFIAPKASGWTDMKKDMNLFLDFIDKTIKPFLESYSPKETPNGYIEAYLQHIASSNPDSSFHGKKGLQNLRSNLIDLLIPAMESPSAVLQWAMLILIKYPDIQEKIQNELDLICGREHLPNWENHKRLHYTNAFIHELLRFTCIAPFGVSHFTRKGFWTPDKKYCIPAGTIIFSNLYRMTHNPEVFPNPEEFLPGRFLDEKNNFVKHEQNVAFGIGTRNCLAVPLSEMTLFLFLSGMLHRFRFRSPLGNLNEISLEPIYGYTLWPQPFEVITDAR